MSNNSVSHEASVNVSKRKNLSGIAALSAFVLVAFTAATFVNGGLVSSKVQLVVQIALVAVIGISSMLIEMNRKSVDASLNSSASTAPPANASFTVQTPAHARHKKASLLAKSFLYASVVWIVAAIALLPVVINFTLANGQSIDLFQTVSGVIFGIFAVLFLATVVTSTIETKLRFQFFRELRQGVELNGFTLLNSEIYRPGHDSILLVEKATDEHFRFDIESDPQSTYLAWDKL